MKRFLLNIFVVLAVASLIVAAVNVMLSLKMRGVSYELPDSIHTIVVGHSTTACALADAPEVGFLNMSKLGSHIRYVNPVLDTLLARNPQIDTVWIAHGRYSCKYEADSVASLSFSSMRRHLPMFFSYGQPQGFWPAFLTNLASYQALFTLDPIDAAGAFSKSSIRDYEFGPEVVEETNIPVAVEWYDNEAMARGGNRFGLQWSLDSIPRAHAAHLSAIDICRRHGVVPVLFFPPLYHMDRWYDLNDFVEYMSVYDPEILVADYEDFNVPDDSYRKDIQHLNAIGQRFFSDYLLCNGVRCVPLRQWRAEKCR